MRGASPLAASLAISRPANGDTGALERIRVMWKRSLHVGSRAHIGYGAPHKHDTRAAHGEPLGEEEIRLAKRSYGWPEDAKFLVPDGVREHFRDGVAIAAKAFTKPGSRNSNPTEGSIPILPTREVVPLPETGG